jgi:hypothetical protein
MFRATLCPSSGAREYYTSGCCLSYLVLGFQAVGIVCICGLCVRFAGFSNIKYMGEIKYLYILFKDFVEESIFFVKKFG